ncbi:M13 family metallopeptidase [uncultured Alistipes sp.]|uniref:M13 family metallopeptidase n=1 Tax=uncultured Alistipes sp. TaxID=538949 RepID=UPI00260DDAD0|nr:M13 family metallopeptidase [uncultured Alistipes sp.]
MKRFILFATVACMMSCNNKPAKMPAIDTSNFDLSVAPNEDFYQYATGGWQAKNPLKPEFSRYGSFDVLRENNEVRINELFQEMTKMQAAAGSVDQKISDLYKMGLDSIRLNNEGAAPVKADLAGIMQIEKGSSLTKKLAELILDTGNPLFTFGVMADLMDSNTNAFYLQQAGLGMGDRDYYLEESNAALKKGYETLLAQLYTLAGVDETQAAKAAADVVAFETELARISWSNVELRDVARGYNPMTIDELKKNCDAIDWALLFGELDKMGAKNIDRAIVGQPSFFEGMSKLVAATPIETLRYYLAGQYLTNAASYLSDDFYAASFDFFGRQMAGKQEQKPRWKRAMTVPNAVLGEAVGEMYVAKYFPKEDKERMLALVGNLQTALGEHIAALDWMSDATKAKAQEKLASFRVKIGYPDKWKDYTLLTIDPAMDYWHNIKAASLWSSKDNLSKYGKPVDKEEWLMSPQTVNAYYNPTTNEICFPAAILQPPFYNPDADDAVNYGAIGVVIGHEMTHGFDDQGRNFDKDGNMNNWWTDEDAAAFKAKTDVLVKQFDAIEVLPAKEGQPALFANGALSLGENIADQGGLRVAYTAYHNTLEGKDTPAPIDGFSPDQRFYLAYAQLWAQNIRDEEIARLTKIDVHSLGKWRVNATLRNLQTFYDAFGITDGAMFMPEEERVIIW